MSMKSGNHEDAKQRKDGTWYCRSCGAESASFQLFEEAGDFEGCVADTPAEAGKMKESLERAAKAAEETAKSLVVVEEASRRAAERVKKALDAVHEDYDRRTKIEKEKVERWILPKKPLQYRKLEWKPTTEKWKWPEDSASWRETGTVTNDGLRASLGLDHSSESRPSSKSEISVYGPERVVRDSWIEWFQRANRNP